MSYSPIRRTSVVRPARSRAQRTPTLMRQTIERLEARQLLSGSLNITPTAAKTSILHSLLAANTGIVITSSKLTSHTLVNKKTKKTSISIGTYTNPGGVFGIGNGIVMSTGNVSQYSAPPPASPNTSTGFGVAATSAGIPSAAHQRQ